jgi:hypothetical protein
VEGRALRRLVFGAVAIYCALTVGCSRRPKYLPIVFDDWWNIDYVGTGCEGVQQTSDPCPAVPDLPRQVVHDFEDQLEAAFASEEPCHGLTLLHFPSDAANTVMQRQGSFWQLMLYLDGRSDNQAGQFWGLAGPKTNLQGRILTPDQVMRQVCSIAKGIGGKTQ